MRRISPSWRSGEEGSAAAEASIVMSVLLLLVVGSMEFGRAFWTANTMLLAVEEAGRYAMTYRHEPASNCAAQSQAASCPLLSSTPVADCSASLAQQILSDYQLPDIAVSVSEDTMTSPSTITVCASYSFDFIAPGLLPYGPLHLARQVTVPLI
jgi:Flp pilus assembly protein TadG